MNSQEVTKCVNCGGNLAFDAKSGCLVCKNCKNKIAINIERATEQDFYADVSKTKAALQWQKETRVVKCKNCGATEILDNKNLADVCPFCSSSNLEGGGGQDKGFSPNGIIPFSVTKEQAYKNICDKIGKSAWTPRAFKENFAPGSVRGVYTPVYTFDTKVTGYYSGRFGRNETKTSTRYVNGRRETYSYSEVVWYNRNGNISQFFDDILVDAGDKINGEAFSQLAPFETNASVKYDKKFLMGYAASTSNLALTTAFDRAKVAVRARLEDAIKQQNRAEIVADINIDLDYNSISYKYLLLPVYTSAFSYEGKNYNIFVNGATGKVAGKLPLAKGKVWAVVLTSLLIIGGVIAFIVLS